MPLSYQVEDDNIVALRERYTSYILDHQNITDGAGWVRFSVIFCDFPFISGSISAKIGTARP